MKDQPQSQFIKALYCTDNSTKMAHKLMIIFPIKYIDGTQIMLYGLLISFMNPKITLAIYIITDLETSFNLLLKHKPTLVNLGIKELIHIAIIFY